MIKEARPTMFMSNDDTNKLEFKRQIIIWRTGGEMDKGGKAYEIEFRNALAHWEKGNFEHGIIPLFFDWTTRPGITKEFYPGKQILKKCFEADIHLTINSDAHHPNEIANNFEDVASVLLDIGYNNIYIFDEGKWCAVQL